MTVSPGGYKREKRIKRKATPSPEDTYKLRSPHGSRDFKYINVDSGVREADF